MSDEKKLNEDLGFELTDPNKKKDKNISHDVVHPTDSDGGHSIEWYQQGSAATAAIASTYDVDFLNFKSEEDLINQYRFVSTIPEVDDAIENIISDAIINDEFRHSIGLVLDKTKFGDVTKDRINESYDEVLKLLKFSTENYNIFRRWYIDGRLAYQILIDKDKPKDGILDLRYLEASRIKKIKKINKEVEEINGQTIEVIKSVDEVFLYKPEQTSSGISLTNTGAIEYKKDAVCYVTSGIVGKGGMVLSNLHKAVRVANQLRLLENSLVIYRLSRAPERRIFYVDVGNLPATKANAYVNDIVNKFKNKIKYDASSGNVTDSNDVMSIMEDYFLPRREGGKGTEVSTLPGGSNLGDIDDVLYFQKKLYKSLNVPSSRMQEDAGFSLGKSTEISRDEVKFSRFLTRLRTRFTKLFTILTKAQCVLKGIVTEEEWDAEEENLYYDHISDVYFSELKDIEILQERMALLQQIDLFAGRFYSNAWIKKNILKQNDEEIEEMQKEIDEEIKNGEHQDDDEEDDAPPPANEEFNKDELSDEFLQALLEDLNDEETGS